MSYMCRPVCDLRAPGARGRREGDCSQRGRRGEASWGRGLCRLVSRGDGKKAQAVEAPVSGPRENVGGERVGEIGDDSSPDVGSSGDEKKGRMQGNCLGALLCWWQRWLPFGTG